MDTNSYTPSVLVAITVFFITDRTEVTAQKWRPVDEGTLRKWDKDRLYEVW